MQQPASESREKNLQRNEQAMEVIFEMHRLREQASQPRNFDVITPIPGCATPDYQNNLP